MKVKLATKKPWFLLLPALGTGRNQVSNKIQWKN